MNETPAQYTRRMLSHTKGVEDALRIQAATGKRLERAIEGLTRKQMTSRTAPERWSIAEILAHLAEAELVGGYRLRFVLNDSGTEIRAFDQNKWAETSDYAHQDPLRSLELFHILRRSNLELLKSIPKRKWSCFGMHSERGKETVGRIVRMYAGHDVNHLRQIEGIARQCTA